MQLVLAIDDRDQVLAEIDRRLRAWSGRPGPLRRLDPVSQLVFAMIGSRTYGEVASAAFQRLRTRFVTWEHVLGASEEDVRRDIKSVTYAAAKARHLRAALDIMIRERGALDLEFLRTKTASRALMWLERLPGVGRKVSASTLNFSALEMKALVIDTHHLRVLRRLGIVGGHVVAEHAYDHVMPHLPAHWSANDVARHHVTVKALGQRLCRAGAPVCAPCPLLDLCSLPNRFV
ncbi:MAG: endonuclease III domain-containing protein [Geminicoccaceae bacterium]